MTIGLPERVTQDRVIALFRDELGYRTLGDWTDRTNNSNVEVDLLTAYLSGRGYSAVQIGRALYRLRLVEPVGALVADFRAGFAVSVAPAEVPLGKGAEPFFSCSFSSPAAMYLTWNASKIG